MATNTTTENPGSSLLIRTVIAVLVLIAPTAVLAEPLVEDTAGCLHSVEVEAALSKVVLDHPGSDTLSITVVASPGEGATISTLRAVSPRGEVVLERIFEMNRSDCGSSAELFATVLDAFLREMPATAWNISESAPPKPETKTVVVERLVTRSSSSSFCYISADSRWAPNGADLEMGLLLDVGAATHRIATSAAVRITTPADLGRGHFLEGYALLGVGWSYGTDGWLVRVEARTGGLLAYGYGFDKSSRSWLPWFEGQASALVRWRRSLFGVQLGMSPLKHEILATGAEATIPQVRVGLIWAKPLFSSKKQ